MAVDSIKANANQAYSKNRRSLEDERAEELDSIENKYRKQVKDTREIRSQEIKKIKEDEAQEIQELTLNSNEKVKKIKEAQRERIKSYEEETSKLTSEAQKKLQQKANELNKFSKELEDQEERIKKQHSASLSYHDKLHEKNQRSKIDELNKLTQEITEKHDKNIKELKEKQNEQLKHITKEGLSEKSFIQEKMNKDIQQARVQNELNLQSYTAEEEHARKAHEEKLNNLRVHQALSQSSAITENDDNMQNIHHKNKKAIQDEMLRGQRELNKMNEFNIQNRIVTEKSNKNDIAAANQRAKIRVDSIESESKFQTQVAQKTYDKQREILQNRNTKILNELENNHEKLRTDSKIGYDAKMKMVQDHHNANFQKTVVTNQNEILNQEQRAQKQLNDINVSAATAIKATQSKQSDPFYKMRSFEANVSETDTDLIVNIKVPEHEKDTVRVTTKPGSVTVSGTRRYENKGKTEDGKSIATNSYQSYSETVPFKGSADANKMSRQYADGKLTVRIPKV